MHSYTFDFFSRENEKICVTKSVHIEGYLPDHTHEYFEIVYVCDGMGYHILNSNKSIVKKGDLIFMSYTSFHNFQPITSDFKWINCLFLPEVIDSSLITSHNAADVLKLALFTSMFEFDTISLSDLQLHSAMVEFDNLLHDMLREYDNCTTGYQEVLKHYLLILLIKIFRSNAQTSVQGEYALKDNTLVNLVLEYMNNNTSNEDIKLETIAKKAYMSPKYFSKLFKQKTGISLTQFIHNIKIDKACELLTDTDLPVIIIMNHVGLKDGKFFYRVFKQKMGVTPGEYRNHKKSLKNT